MTFCQILLFITGTVIVGPLATTIHPWNYDDPNHEYYCDYTLVMFSGMQIKILLYKKTDKNYLYFFLIFSNLFPINVVFSYPIWICICLDQMLLCKSSSSRATMIAKNLLQNVRLIYFTKTTYLVLDILAKN